MVAQAKAPNRLEQRKARTRAALIGAARRLLAEGRTSVSIQEITDAADVGFGSFYNHFESKELLFETVVEETLQAHGAALDELTAGIEDPAEVFTASFRLTGRMQRRLPEQVRVLLNAGAGILLRDQGLAPRARRDLVAADAAGKMDVPDPDLALMAVGGAMLGLLQLLEDNPDVDDAATADAFTERVLGMLGVTPARARRLCARPLPDLPDLPALAGQGSNR